MQHDYSPRVPPWKIDESDFSALASLKEKAGFLLGYAVLAPSGHNTQPWKFRLTDNGVLVYADYARRLPVANPDDRELVMSVGATIMNFRVAAAHFGLASDVRYLPEAGKDDLLASIKLREDTGVDRELAELFPAILKRRTNRFPYEAGQLSESDREKLAGISAGGRASLEIVTDEGAKASIAELVSQADITRMGDKAFRRELAEWVVPNNSSRGDGISADCLGLPGFLSGVSPWLVRSFNSGKSQARKDGALARESAALVVLHGDDAKESVIEAGELLELLVLTATSMGLQYSFFNLPVELDDLRAKLKSTVDTADLPQLLLRVGYGDSLTIASPRRELDSVLVG